MTAEDVDVFLQEETEGEEDDQEQSVGAPEEAAQVFFQEIYFPKTFAIPVCLLQARDVIVNNIGSASEGQV